MADHLGQSLVSESPARNLRTTFWHPHGRARAQHLPAGAGKDPPTPAVRLGDLLTTPPWPALLARNTPGHAATPAPIFLAQGADDDRVTPAVTRALVQRLCRAGDRVELRTWQDVGHFDIPEVARRRRAGVDR